MYRINVSFDSDLYKDLGLTITQQESSCRLETPLEETLKILEVRLKDLLEEIPEDERDVLILSGRAPVDIYLTVFSILGHHFQETIHENKRDMIHIPR